MPDRVVKTTLVIDEHGAVRAVKSVGEESSRAEGKMKGLDKSAKGLGSSLKNLIIGAGGLTALAYGLDRVISKTTETAEATEKFHNLSGMSEASSLKLGVALKARGIDTEKAAKNFAMLAKNMQTAERQERGMSRAQVKALKGHKALTKELGVQATAFKELLGPQGVGAIGGTDENKFTTVIKAFEAMPGSMRKARLEMQIFGRSGTAMSTVLEAGNLGLTHQIKLVEKFYPTLKGGTQGLHELLERQTEAKMAWEGFQFTIGVKLIPVLNKLIPVFTKVIQEVEKGEGVFGTIKNVINEVVGVLKAVVGPSNAAAVAIGGVVSVMAVDKIAGFGKGLKGLAAILPDLMFSPEFLAGIAAVLAAAAIVKHFLPKPKPGEAKALHDPRKQGALGPTGSTRWHLATGAIAAGMPGIGGLSGHLGGESVIKGGVEAGMLNAIEKTNAVNRPGPHGEIHVYLDGKKIADAVVQNTYGVRRIAEGVTHYGLKRNARE